MTDKESGNWDEYKNLVIKELERGDNNAVALLHAVQANSEKLSSINTAIQTLKETVAQSNTYARELEKNVNVLDKEFSSLKARVMIIGASIAIVATAAVNLAIQLLK